MVPTNSRERRRLKPGDRVLVIANPATRVDVEAVYRSLGRALPPGIRMHLHLTKKTETAADLAKRLKDAADCIIAVGGDGTVSSVAAALHGSDVLLGIIPGGSTNIIAQELRHSGEHPGGGEVAVRRLRGSQDGCWRL